VVEQSAVHRQPVGALAPQSPAAQAFSRLWAAIEKKLDQPAVDAGLSRARPSG
jgi:MinD-like ATPase involved in chromosome partitioning or flagellar assembly